MKDIEFVRQKAEGGPGYLYEGTIYATKDTARAIRLKYVDLGVYSQMQSLIPILLWDENALERLLTAAEAVVNGDIWANDLVGDNVVAVVQSKSGKKEYFVRRIGTVLTCECQGFERLVATRVASGKYVTLCHHILCYLIFTWNVEDSEGLKLTCQAAIF